MDGDDIRLLEALVYDYMVQRNYHRTAAIFADEAGLTYAVGRANSLPTGFLADWWAVFWESYNARRARQAGIPSMDPLGEIGIRPGNPLAGAALMTDSIVVARTTDPGPALLGPPPVRPPPQIQYRAPFMMAPPALPRNMGQLPRAPLPYPGNMGQPPSAPLPLPGRVMHRPPCVEAMEGSGSNHSSPSPPHSKHAR